MSIDRARLVACLKLLASPHDGEALAAARAAARLVEAAGPSWSVLILPQPDRPAKRSLTQRLADRCLQHRELLTEPELAFLLSTAEAQSLSPSGHHMLRTIHRRVTAY
jgi:hypothetical protein